MWPRPAALLVLPAVLLLAGCVRGTVPAPVAERPEVRPLPVPAGAQPVRVRWVSDGDTLGVQALRRGVLPVGEDLVVRLLEVDAPESKRPGTPVACGALAATRALRALAPVGSTVRVEADRELRDRYGRTLLYVWNDAGTFVNERLVREGHGRALLVAPNDRHIDRMRAAEAGARAAARGLWGCG